MNKFLVKFDFETLIDEDNIDQITKSNDRTLTDAIDSAVEEVAGYIRHRYDFDQVFKVVIPYNDATAFVVGDRVYWSEAAYSETASYTIGQRVSYNNNIYSAIGTPTVGPFLPAEWNLLTENNTFYTCISASTGNLPTNTTYFTAGDNRNPKIKEITVDVTLYNIHSKISPRNIPDVRRVRYDGFGNKNDSENAIRYLEKVQKGQITPDLPVIDPVVQNTERFSYGITSDTKHSY
jgi:hypothetical protein